MRMYFHKRNPEPLPKEQTEVWECETQECIGWMRKDFSDAKNQKCPLCGNNMITIRRLIDKIPPNPHRR